MSIATIPGEISDSILDFVARPIYNYPETLTQLNFHQADCQCFDWETTQAIQTLKICRLVGSSLHSRATLHLFYSIRLSAETSHQFETSIRRLINLSLSIFQHIRHIYIRETVFIRGQSFYPTLIQLFDHLIGLASHNATQDCNRPYTLDSLSVHGNGMRWRILSYDCLGDDNFHESLQRLVETPKLVRSLNLVSIAHRLPMSLFEYPEVAELALMRVRNGDHKTYPDWDHSLPPNFSFDRLEIDDSLRLHFPLAVRHFVLNNAAHYRVRTEFLVHISRTLETLVLQECDTDVHNLYDHDLPVLRRLEFREARYWEGLQLGWCSSPNNSFVPLEYRPKAQSSIYPSRDFFKRMPRLERFTLAYSLVVIFSESLDIPTNPAPRSLTDLPRLLIRHSSWTHIEDALASPYIRDTAEERRGMAKDDGGFLSLRFPLRMVPKGALLDHLDQGLYRGYMDITRRTLIRDIENVVVPRSCALDYVSVNYDL